MGRQACWTSRTRSNPWAAELEKAGEELVPEAEDSGEDAASRGEDPSGEEEASRDASPSGSPVGSPRDVPHGEELQDSSSSGDDDAFCVARSRRVADSEEGSGNRGGRREPRTKAVHDMDASARRGASREDAGGPQEGARASGPQTQRVKKRVWRAANE